VEPGRTAAREHAQPRIRTVTRRCPRESLRWGSERFKRRVLEGVLALVSFAGKTGMLHEPNENQTAPCVHGGIGREGAAVAEGAVSHGETEPITVVPLRRRLPAGQLLHSRLG
jgi:hypothetical protein